MDLFAKSLEYTNGYCYVDGVLQSTNAACVTAGKIALAILAPLILVGIALFVWWIVTLVHVISHENVPNRVLWIVLHFVIGAMTAPIYFFAVQREYNKSKGAHTKPKTE